VKKDLSYYIDHIILISIFTVIMAVPAFIVSAYLGKKHKDSYNQKVRGCQVVNAPDCGRVYAQEMCSINYSVDRCY
jgi:flagellar basal body-associated protein FliL